MLLVTVLIPTIVAIVSSYMPDRKEEDEMDRQDITNKRKQHKTPIILLKTVLEKTTPPGIERVSGIDESDDYIKMVFGDIADETMSKVRPGGPTISDNYNFNSKGSLGGELEYIFNRDKFELWD